MKQAVLVCLGIVVIAVILGGGYFYWQNLRGAGPAWKPPPEDIADILAEPKNDTDLPLNIPSGFRVSIFAKDLGAVRVLTQDPRGAVLASIPEAGNIVALPDENNDAKADSVSPVVEGLNRPHGIAVRCGGPTKECKLYIAESHQVTVWDYDQNSRTASGGKKILGLPDDGGHWTRTLMFLPSVTEDTLLVSIGSSCNVCHEADERRARIIAMNPDGTNVRTYARGLRNAVFMANRPTTQEIWATEMGRDLLGDDIPPDEINIVEEGGNYGWPICYGKNMHDTDFDKNTYIRNPCMEPFETPSHIDVPAHSAPLGLAFIPFQDVPQKGWPKEYWGDLLVAYHGSWNRSTPTGYKIVRYRLDEEGTVEGVEDFISGWLTREGALGRPVDIMIESGGNMYVSDDKAGIIYLVSSNTTL